MTKSWSPDSPLTRNSVSGLLRWYEDNGRSLPWRESRDPYAVWVSEIMLQQTTVHAVIPFYRQWMHVYPDIQSLSLAQEREVLLLWEGLGYYSRARNLLESARMVVDLYNGVMPDEYPRLRSLPGIGDYTARAILSICFGRPTPIMDANVRRIGQRLHAWASWGKKEEQRLLALFSELIPRDRPGDFNEALMELGQTVCQRVRPLCGQCPLSSGCRAFLTGRQDTIPAPRSTRAVAAQSRRVVLVRRDDTRGMWETWLIRREAGILKGLWVFPAEADLPGGEDLDSGTGQRLGLVGRLRPRVHSYTRYRERLLPVVYRTAAGFRFPGSDSEGKWVRLPDLRSHPMPSIYRKIAEELERFLSESMAAAR